MSCIRVSVAREGGEKVWDGFIWLGDAAVIGFWTNDVRVLETSFKNFFFFKQKKIYLPHIHLTV